ncbi:OCIA domain-containing protein 1 isoform X2 [Orussus abietinus]|uniref:OCIA domain-containing protein 1 isoform X2 n=1 Tax=Orussus abietinus TaxID=222816 RepID=UPI000626CF06|nr:OCIA domain-containing protein 1 isoform X2 [Orussus abietinus]
MGLLNSLFLVSTTPPSVPLKERIPYLTPEERKVYDECVAQATTSDVWLPGVMFGFSTYIGMKFIPWLHAMEKSTKMFILASSVFTGIIMAKVRVSSKCVQQLLLLPDGNLRKMAEFAREGKQQFVSDIYVPADDSTTTTLTDNSSSSGVDMDIYHSPSTFDSFAGSSSSSSADSDNASLNSPEGPSTQSALTYDELRARNREEYAHSRNKVLSDAEGRRRIQRLPPSAPTVNEGPTPIVEKTKYGDVWG